MNRTFDWDTGFSLAVSADPGIDGTNAETNAGTWISRRLSDMKDQFYDHRVVSAILKKEDPVLYRFQDLGAPEREGDLSFGLSVLLPMKIGDEYNMTKGHFHKKLMTAEVYYCLSGTGMLMLENQEGDWRTIGLSAGNAVYVPRGYAHRSINTGSETLVTYFVYGGDSGHDYKTIETRGFRHLVVERGGKPAVINNPAWVGQ